MYVRGGQWGSLVPISVIAALANAFCFVNMDGMT
jgi:hypothetical protein